MTKQEVIDAITVEINSAQLNIDKLNPKYSYVDHCSFLRLQGQLLGLNKVLVLVNSLED